MLCTSILYIDVAAYRCVHILHQQAQLQSCKAWQLRSLGIATAMWLCTVSVAMSLTVAPCRKLHY